MEPKMRSLDTLNDIRKMMEKSSTFISLSGWSGIAAGLCGLAGAYVTHVVILQYYSNGTVDDNAREALKRTLIGIAAIVFALAFITAFLFTYLRTRREGIAIWGQSARRLLWNTMLPMIAAGMLILRLISLEHYSLIAPCALIFYGLALINGSKYTLGEIRYLGYFELLLGFLSLWFPSQWLLLLAAGFGALHIIYGAIMWFRYDRKMTMQTS